MLKVFVSFSGHDRRLVDLLAVATGGIELYRFDHDVQPGTELPAKVKAAISGPDLVVVLLTAHGQRSAWVQQEIGIAEAAGKRVVPILEKGATAPGVLVGREHIALDPTDPSDALRATAEFLQRSAARKQIREAEEAQRRASGAALAFLVGLFILGASRE